MNKIPVSSKGYWTVHSNISGRACYLQCLLFLSSLVNHLFSNLCYFCSAINSLAVSLTTGFLAFALIPTSHLNLFLVKKKWCNIFLLGTTVLVFILLISANIYSLLIVRALQGIFIAEISATATMAFSADKVDHRDIFQSSWTFMLQEASISSELTGRTIIAVALDYVNLKTAIFITVSVITLCAAILFLYLLKNSCTNRSRLYKYQSL